jgi:dienelactone hydrolase
VEAAKPLIALIGAAVCAGGAAAQPAALPSGSWAGTAELTRGGGAYVPFAMSIQLRGRRATVSLGSGHPARTEVPARLSRGRIRVTLPGRPWRLAFEGRVRGRFLTGTFRQGSLQGRFRLRRRVPLEAATVGLYRFADGSPLGTFEAFGPRVATRFEQSEIRGLYRTARGRYAIGAGVQTRNPAAGTAVFGANHLVWNGERAERVALRQEDVWVRSGQALLACTLTIPPGESRRPALTFAHGAGMATRAFNSGIALYVNHLGLVTLSCDKRGIGQSGGRYPGEFPSQEAVDQYARDVAAQARFLATQPEVDPSRVGVAGASQAGWIMPPAAVREPAIRFMIGLVSPTLTQGETDLWANLNDQGRSAPTRTDEEMEAEVRRSGPSGVDPMPSIRALRIPAIWLYGAKDRTVPSRLCIERLDPLTREPGRDFTYVNFPGGTHGLIKTENGLLAEAARSSRIVDGLWPTVRDWLSARGFSAVS